MTSAEWQLLTASGVVTYGWGPFLPTVPEIHKALLRMRGMTEPDLDVEAGHAYERVCAASSYTSDGGAFWNYRAVKESCGAAAAEAFVAAGGNNAFSQTWNESKRREAFVAAYQRAVREEPAKRLLPGGDAPKALPAPEPEITQHEAWSALEKLKAYLPPGVEIPKPKAKTAVVMTDERMAELRAQAEKLRAEEGEGDGVLA